METLALPASIRKGKIQFSPIKLEHIDKLKEYWREVFGSGLIDLDEYLTITEFIERVEAQAQSLK